MSTTNIDDPRVSVIITTRNEQDHIGTCLKSVKGQTYKNIELIVVDNASVDRTKGIARDYGAAVYDKGPERSAQRNFGATHARGDYVLFLDADMELSSSVIAQCVGLIRTSKGNNRKLSAVIIPERSVGTGFWTTCKILERKFYEGVDWMEAARFFDRRILLSLKGFDERLTGPEDFDLSQRVIAQRSPSAVARISSYIYHHEGRIVLSELLRKKWYYGKKMSRYVGKKENASFSAKQANPISRYILFFSKPSLLFSDPIHAVGMIVMKTLELGALAGGMIAGHI